MAFTPNRAAAPYTEEQKKKRQMILMINKRIHKRHEKLGGRIAENVSLESHLRNEHIAQWTMRYESPEGYEYSTLSTSRAALDAIEMEEIEFLAEHTAPISELRKDISKKYFENEALKPDGESGTDAFGRDVILPDEQIRRFGELRQKVRDFIEENSENWYKLMEELNANHMTMKTKTYEAMAAAIDNIRDREEQDRDAMKQKIRDYWAKLNMEGIFKKGDKRWWED